MFFSISIEFCVEWDITKWYSVKIDFNQPVNCQPGLCSDPVIMFFGISIKFCVEWDSTKWYSVKIDFYRPVNRQPDFLPAGSGDVQHLRTEGFQMVGISTRSVHVVRSYQPDKKLLWKIVLLVLLLGILAQMTPGVHQSTYFLMLIHIMVKKYPLQ